MEVSLEERCRVCFEVDQWVLLHPLADEDTRKLFEDCTAIQVQLEGNNSPKHLCVVCYNKCVSWQNFKYQAQEADRKINRRITIEPGILLSEVKPEPIEYNTYLDITDHLAGVTATRSYPARSDNSDYVCQIRQLTTSHNQLREMFETVTASIIANQNQLDATSKETLCFVKHLDKRMGAMEKVDLINRINVDDYFPIASGTVLMELRRKAKDEAFRLALRKYFRDHSRAVDPAKKVSMCAKMLTSWLKDDTLRFIKKDKERKTCIVLGQISAAWREDLKIDSSEFHHAVTKAIRRCDDRITARMKSALAATASTCQTKPEDIVIPVPGEKSLGTKHSEFRLPDEPPPLAPIKRPRLV